MFNLLSMQGIINLKKEAEMTQRQRTPTGFTHLSDEQRKTLEKLTEKHKTAQRNMAKCMGVLWNAQLDLAIASQNSEFFQRVSAGPLNIFDDCNCCSIIIF